MTSKAPQRTRAETEAHGDPDKPHRDGQPEEIDPNQPAPPGKTKPKPATTGKTTGTEEDTIR